MSDDGESFGTALRAFRGPRKNPAIARTALGESATKEEVRDCANYFSRIERNEVPGVGLEKLQLLAKGYGFSLLSDFFAQIEQHWPSEALKKSVKMDQDQHHPNEVDHGAEVSATAARTALAELVSFIHRYTVALTTAATRAGTGVSRSVSSPRAHRARRRKGTR